MRVGKILSIVVVSIASLIVIAAATIAVFFFASSRSGKQNFAPSEGQEAVSPVGATVLISQTRGDSSFLFRKDRSNGTTVRLTSALTGVESEATFSHDGKLVVYSFASSPDSKSTVWMVGADGSNPHAITGT